jgi:hypothetical protein
MDGPAGKVRIGFFSFTEVTDAAAHRAYHEWHQLDHLPEQLPLPGVCWGQRWVSTPACRAARAVPGGPLQAVHYVTLYLMTDPVPETLRLFAEWGATLRRAGRFFEQRHSHLSGPFDVVSAAAAGRVLVSAPAVAFRPTTGVYVVVTRPSPDGGAEADRVEQEAEQEEEVLAVPEVAGVWTFAGAPELAGERWRPGHHAVTVCFLDGDPVDAAAALGPMFAGGGRRRTNEVVFAGPFETITPWHWDWFD